jgi:glycine/D-amino acid oxidase-like deaminating enzyme
MTSSDVIVIGGGIAGVATAYYLTRHGHRVTLVERGELAGEASGLNAGSIDAIGWGRVPDLQVHLTTGSFELFQALERDEGHDIELRQSGYLQAIHTEAQLRWARERVRDLTSKGHSAELLDAEAARTLEPELSPALPGYVHYPERAQANPMKATRAFAEAASRRGARVREGRDVRGLRRDGQSWRVTAGEETLAADALVLAAGPWCVALGALLGLEIPIVPVRGQMWATAPLPARLGHVIGSSESIMHWQGTPRADDAGPPHLTHRGPTRVIRHLYGRQTRDGAIVFGGDRQLIGFDKKPDPAGIAVNREHTWEILPFLREIPVARMWAGLMPFSLDGKPLIGRLPGHEQLYIVGGLASSGFGRGPMAGKLVADLIHTGVPHPALAEADPARCVWPRRRR